MTREAQERSQAAQDKVDNTRGMLDESARVRGLTESLIAAHRDEFNRQLQENRMNIQEVENMATDLNTKISDINEMVGYMSTCIK